MARPRKHSTRTEPRRPQDTTHEGRPSPVAENYLLSLYVLREEGSPATPRRLADHLMSLPVGEGLGTSLPSVMGMLRRMTREGLVETLPTKEVRLTEKGERLAEDMVRRHRLAERMVVDLLGVELHRAHIEAHRLEHALSPYLMARIAERVKDPSTCPFGRRIPGSGPSPSPNPSLRLSQAVPGTTYLVDRVPEEDQDLVRFLVEHRILPGQEVSIAEAATYRGVLAIHGPLGQEVALGMEVATRVWVHPAPRQQFHQTQRDDAVRDGGT